MTHQLARLLPQSLKQLVKRALGLREYDRSKPFYRIPGMMGSDERENLYQICRKDLRDVGAAVEFGCFLGASTSAIKAGLLANPMISAQRELGRSVPSFNVYDCFRTPTPSFFAGLTRSYAEGAGLGHLIKEHSGWLDFYEVFRANVGADDDLLVVHRGLISELEWPKRPIEFLHLDLPKDWSQARFIAQQTFPSLVPGAYLLYQDFVYHWSAELIATIGFLVKRGAITPERITGSTLTCMVTRAISVAEVEELTLEMGVPDQVMKNFASAMESCDILLEWEARIILRLAKAVYKHERVAPAAAYVLISEAVQQLRAAVRRGEPGESAFAALREIFEYGMKMPKSWE